MENQKDSIPSSNLNKPKSKIAIYAILAVIAIVVVIAGFLYYNSTLQDNSLAKGSFASYYGEAPVSDKTLGMQMRIEIVDFNNTHIKTLTYIKLISSDKGTLSETQFSNWTSRTDQSGAMEGMIMTSKKADQVFFPNLGTRDCIIYEYKYKAGSGADGTMTMYLNEKIGLPYKIIYNLNIDGTNIILDMPLENTNIAALK